MNKNKRIQRKMVKHQSFWGLVADEQIELLTKKEEATPAKQTKDKFQYKLNTYEGLLLTGRKLPQPQVETKPNAPALLEVTRFLPSTANRKRKPCV
jgi:hypothetical protein